jgi:hypothetical protein
MLLKFPFYRGMMPCPRIKRFPLFKTRQWSRLQRSERPRIRFRPFRNIQSLQGVTTNLNYKVRNGLSKDAASQSTAMDYPKTRRHSQQQWIIQRRGVIVHNNGLSKDAVSQSTTMDYPKTRCHSLQQLKI